MLIKENDDEEMGTAYVINKWQVIKTIQYNDGHYAETDAPDISFDFDTYKILVKHFLKKDSARHIIPYERRLMRTVEQDDLATIT